MTVTQKVDALNHLETQYDEIVSYINTHTHTDRYYTKSEMDSKYYSSSNDGHGSGFVCETLDGYTATQILNSAIPPGLIAIWNGEVGTVPAGWVVCNGSNGTPDLRDRFVIGAGGSYPRGTTGGSKNVTPTCTFTSAGHTLTDAELPAHTHSYTDRKNNTGSVYGPYYSLTTVSDISRTSYYTCSSTQTYTGSRIAHSHENSSLSITQLDIRPPYVAKLFIMKL
jgi:microcystin-dependent protein